MYAPSGFASGFYAAMRANSATGEFASAKNRDYLETYNALRGVHGGAENQVLPRSPVRFVDGEAVEDWIAQNSSSYLGFEFAERGKGPGRNPGYTVFFLNTWDSPAAKAELEPEHEYHVFKIDRTDPDTGEFDGIDWARIWGGRYRFIMVDRRAAPNPYEAETWANRNTTTWGSANYDPPRPLDLPGGGRVACGREVPRPRARTRAGHERGGKGHSQGRGRRVWLGHALSQRRSTNGRDGPPRAARLVSSACRPADCVR